MKEKGKRDVLLWGSGKTAEKFLEYNQTIHPRYLVDNDETMNGRCKYGYKVIHPSCIKDLSKYLIVVASIHYKEIFSQLQGKGLVEGDDFISLYQLSDYMMLSYNIDFESEMKSSMEIVMSHALEYSNRPILFTCWSPEISLKNNVPTFFEKWNEQNENGTMILAQESINSSRRTSEEFHSFPVIPLPFFFKRSNWPRRQSYSIKDGKLQKEKLQIPSFCQIEDLVNQLESLRLASENLRNSQPDMMDGYEYLMVWYVQVFLNKIFDLLHPTRIYIWNEFVPTHRVIYYVAEKHNIPVRFCEYGNLPGTFQFDACGQMGESWIATHSKEFLAMKVTKEEIESAKKICHFLFLSKENRKMLKNTSIWEALKDKIELGHPVILYTGQFDFACGIYPYTQLSRKYHSPIFESSDEAALYLSAICKRNKWNFIYKIHPQMRNTMMENYADNTILLLDENINDLIDLSDVVVTILSTTSYIGLIRKKPVVMLGYNQLKDKGCTYQAFRREAVEDSIKCAINDGLTYDQVTAFYKHVAQMRKYYLYDDLKEKPIMCGRKIDE